MGCDSSDCPPGCTLRSNIHDIPRFKPVLGSQASQDRIQFRAVLQHVGVPDIDQSLDGAVILTHLNRYMVQPEKVRLSMLASQTKAVRVTLEVE